MEYIISISIFQLCVIHPQVNLKPQKQLHDHPTLPWDPLAIDCDPATFIGGQTVNVKQHEMEIVDIQYPKNLEKWGMDGEDTSFKTMSF